MLYISTFETLYDSNTILITLRINNNDKARIGEENIVGFAKGRPLKNYHLRRGTYDVNLGKKNTAYMDNLVATICKFIDSIFLL